MGCPPPAEDATPVLEEHLAAGAGGRVSIGTSATGSTVTGAAPAATSVGSSSSAPTRPPKSGSRCR